MIFMDPRGTRRPSRGPAASAGRNDSEASESRYRLKGLGRFRQTFGSVPGRGREKQAAPAAVPDFGSRRNFLTRDGRGHLGGNRGDGWDRLDGPVGVLAST